MAPSQNRPGQEEIKFNQRAGIVFHGTEKAERETGVNEEDVGRQSTINIIGHRRERGGLRGNSRAVELGVCYRYLNYCRQL